MAKARMNRISCPISIYPSWQYDTRSIITRADVIRPMSNMIQLPMPIYNAHAFSLSVSFSLSLVVVQHLHIFFHSNPFVSHDTLLIRIKATNEENIILFQCFRKFIRFGVYFWTETYCHVRIATILNYQTMKFERYLICKD